VPRTPGMQSTSRVTDALDKLSLDEAVHVLIGARYAGGIAGSFRQNRLQPRNDCARVLRRQDAGGAERLRPRNAAGHVVFEEGAVESEGNAEIERSGIRGRVEAARPERHTVTVCCPLRSFTPTTPLTCACSFAF